MIAKLYFTYSCEYFLLVPMVLYKVNVIATTFSWKKKNTVKKLKIAVKHVLIVSNIFSFKRNTGFAI